MSLSHGTGCRRQGTCVLRVLPARREALSDQRTHGEAISSRPVSWYMQVWESGQHPKYRFASRRCHLSVF